MVPLEFLGAWILELGIWNLVIAVVIVARRVVRLRYRRRGVDVDAADHGRMKRAVKRCRRRRHCDRHARLARRHVAEIGPVIHDDVMQHHIVVREHDLVADVRRRRIRVERGRSERADDVDDHR